MAAHIQPEGHARITFKCCRTFSHYADPRGILLLSMHGVWQAFLAQRGTARVSLEKQAEGKRQTKDILFGEPLVPIQKRAELWMLSKKLCTRPFVFTTLTSVMISLSDLGQIVWGQAFTCIDNVFPLLAKRLEIRRISRTEYRFSLCRFLPSILSIQIEDENVRNRPAMKPFSFCKLQRHEDKRAAVCSACHR